MPAREIHPPAPQNRSRQLVRYWLKILLIWCPAATLVFVLAFGKLRAFPQSWLVGMIIGAVTASISYWGVNLVDWLHALLARRLGRPTPEHGHLWSMLLAVLFMPPGIYAGFAAARGAGKAFGYRLAAPDWADYRSSILLGVIVVGWFFFIETRRDAEAARNRALLELKEVDNQRLRAQLAALSAQMNPHMLFNALNTIASLVPTDPEVAEEMTVQLADLLRGVLAASRRETHSLAEELAICQAYLAVEQTRFGERLDASVRVDDEIDPRAIRLPVLVIQPLVENAVKYAVAPRAAGGVITLRVDHEADSGATRVTVRDDGPGPGKAEATGGAGVAIDNCRARLALHYGDEADGEIGAELLRLAEHPDGGTEVRLTLPARPNDCKEETT